MIEVATAINTFGTTAPKADFVPPSEQIIALTISQLQDIVAQAVEKAIQQATAPLLARIEAQDVRICALEERGKVPDGVEVKKEIASLRQESDHAAENLDILFRLVGKIRQESEKTPKRSEKAEKHIDDLHRVMKRERATSLTIARAAAMIGLSKSGLKT